LITGKSDLPVDPPDLFVTVEGRRCRAWRATLPIRSFGKDIAVGDWVVEDRFKEMVMPHEAFAHTFGKELTEQGFPIYSVGFGTPSDPRNTVPSSPTITGASNVVS